MSSLFLFVQCEQPSEFDEERNSFFSLSNFLGRSYQSKKLSRYIMSGIKKYHQVKPDDNLGTKLTGGLISHRNASSRGFFNS